MIVKTYQARIRLKPGGSALVVFNSVEERSRAELQRLYNLADDDVIRVEEIGAAVSYDDDQGPILTRTETVALAAAAVALMVLTLWSMRTLVWH